MIQKNDSVPIVMPWKTPEKIVGKSLGGIILAGAASYHSSRGLNRSLELAQAIRECIQQFHMDCLILTLNESVVTSFPHGQLKLWVCHQPCPTGENFERGKKKLLLQGTWIGAYTPIGNFLAGKKKLPNMGPKTCVAGIPGRQRRTRRPPISHGRYSK